MKSTHSGFTTSRDYVVTFHPNTEITCYPWVYHDRYEAYLPKKHPNDPKGHARTGPYDWGKFCRLKDSIQKHGVLCPFIIEYYDKHLPNAQGLQGFESLAIRTGNNRAEAMHQLGKSHAAALFVVPKAVEDQLPEGGVRIPINRSFESYVRRLWFAVDGGDLGPPDAFNDSTLLMDIIRASKAA